MIVVVVVAMLAAGLAPIIQYVLEHSPARPLSPIRSTDTRWFPTQGGELHALIENIFFAIGAFLLIRFTTSRVKDKPIQFKIRSLFLITTVMSCVFAIGRLYRGSIGQIAMTLGGFVALQFLVFAIVSFALRQLNARGEGTFWRTYLGMLVASAANVSLLAIFTSTPASPSRAHFYNSRISDALLHSEFVALCPLLFVVTVSLFGATMVLLYQDGGGDASHAGLLSGVFLGMLSMVAAMPFVAPLLRERSADIMTFPIFLGMGGYFANLQGPRQDQPSLPSQSRVLFPDFDEYCQRLSEQEPSFDDEIGDWQI